MGRKFAIANVKIFSVIFSILGLDKRKQGAIIAASNL